MTTTVETKAEILADLWMSFRGQEEWEDFIEYNDLGLPLAYAVSNNIATLQPLGEKFINETFDVLLSAVGIESDTGFESLDDILVLPAE